jgi:hypothetical protein
MTAPGRRLARSAVALGIGIALPLLTSTTLSGAAAADRGGPAAPAPPVASTAAQTQPGDNLPASPPADPPAQQASVPAQLPAPPAAAAPLTAPAAAPAVAPATTVATATSAVQATDSTAGERVVICKYVRKPYVAEVASHVIIVDEQALLGRGFAGTFPWAFSDAQYYSLAIRWAQSGEQAREVTHSECPQAPTGGGGGGGPTVVPGGSAFGSDLVIPPPRTSSLPERVSAEPARAASGLPQTGAPSGLEELLLLSSAALLVGVTLRVRDATSRGVGA